MPHDLQTQKPHIPLQTRQHSSRSLSARPNKIAPQAGRRGGAPLGHGHVVAAHLVAGQQDTFGPVPVRDTEWALKLTAARQFHTRGGPLRVPETPALSLTPRAPHRSPARRTSRPVTTHPKRSGRPRSSPGCPSMNIPSFAGNGSAPSPGKPAAGRQHPAAPSGPAPTGPAAFGMTSSASKPSTPCPGARGHPVAEPHRTGPQCCAGPAAPPKPRRCLLGPHGTRRPSRLRAGRVPQQHGFAVTGQQSNHADTR